MTPLEKELETALLDLYEQWKKHIRYPKNGFLMMVRPGNSKRYKGPVQTVRHLLYPLGGFSTGFMDLVQVNRIDLTVEWLILNPKWLPLFSDEELDRARAQIRSVISNGEEARVYAS